jgi:hypothetical protein
MTYAEFQERWEANSKAERARYDAMPVAELLTRVECGDFGDYYNIWRALADRATLREAGWILFSVLESDLDYLHRYHCAAALLKLVGMNPERAVLYSGREIHDVAGNLEHLRHLIATRLGS